MIDTHVHLDFPQFDADREAVIERFLASGGQWFLNVGVNTERNKKTLELAEKYEKIYCSLGYHPEELAEKSIEELLLEAKKFLKVNYQNLKVKAIGEIGLDYFHNNQNKEEQKKLFISQLELAIEFSLPVILHCREAYEDVLEIISKFQILNSKQISNSKIQNLKGEKVEKVSAYRLLGKNIPTRKEMKFVLHCYGGNLVQTEKFLKLPNVWFSFTGNITFPKNEDAEIFQVIRKIPLERIIVETDCPFLAPQNHRGQRNEPSYVRMVLKKLAEIKKVSFSEIEEITDQNAGDFFAVR